MRTRIRELDPRELVLLEVNARYMRHETFRRLVENVHHDGALTSIPFAAPAWTKGALTAKGAKGRYEVLSGNHRVMAAIEAGLERIHVMLTDEDVPRARRIAIQLSHNALVGEDDPATLRQLYEAIEEVDLRLYSGLDDKSLGLLKDYTMEPLSEAALDWTTLSIIFLPEEYERAKAALHEARALIGTDETWLARFAEYDRFMEAMAEASASASVTNQATAFLLLLEVYERHRVELTSWWDEEAAAARKDQRAWVPMSLIFARADLPPGAASTVRQAVERMIGAGELEGGALWQAVELWAADYLAGR